jgi:hypothetical protein
MARAVRLPSPRLAASRLKKDRVEKAQTVQTIDQGRHSMGSAQRDLPSNYKKESLHVAGEV